MLRTRTKEINSIQEHGTFEFLTIDEDVPTDYQLAPPWIIFDVKSDLRRKARLVVGGHEVDARDHTKYSSVVRFDSIRLLNVIAKAQNLKVLAGDVGNAYLYAYTLNLDRSYKAEKLLLGRVYMA
jgi:hypothetical protein